MKKLLVLTQYFKPEMGAPQNRLWELVDHYSRSDWEVRVLTAMPNYPKGKVFQGYRNRVFMSEQIENVRVNRSWIYPSNSKNPIPRVLNMLSFSLSMFYFLLPIRRWKPDLVFVESPPLLIGFFGWIFSRLSGGKYWLNISDIWPLSAKEMGAISEGWMYKKLEGLEGFIYRKADLISGQSQEICSWIEKKGHSPILFRNGVDPGRFQGSVKTSPENHEGLKLVYAGLLGYAQNIFGIIENIDFHSLSMEFHVYGGGGQENAISEYCDSNPGSGVFFHGEVKRDEVPGIIMKYDAYLIPLIKHLPGAVPSKLFEACASGLPIIFFGAGEGAKIVIEKELGLVCSPGNYEELSDCLQDLSQDPTRLSTYSENGLKAAQNNFNRNQILKDLIAKTEEYLES